MDNREKAIRNALLTAKKSKRHGFLKSKRIGYGFGGPPTLPDVNVDPSLNTAGDPTTDQINSVMPGVNFTSDHVRGSLGTIEPSNTVTGKPISSTLNASGGVKLSPEFSSSFMHTSPLDKNIKGDTDQIGLTYSPQDDQTSYGATATNTPQGHAYGLNVGRGGPSGHLSLSGGYTPKTHGIDAHLEYVKHFANGGRAGYAGGGIPTGFHVDPLTGQIVADTSTDGGGTSGALGSASSNSGASSSKGSSSSTDNSTTSSLGPDTGTGMFDNPGTSLANMGIGLGLGALGPVGSAIGLGSTISGLMGGPTIGGSLLGTNPSDSPSNVGTATGYSGHTSSTPTSTENVNSDVSNAPTTSGLLDGVNMGDLASTVNGPDAPSAPSAPSAPASFSSISSDPFGDNAALGASMSMGPSTSGQFGLAGVEGTNQSSQAMMSTDQAEATAGLMGGGIGAFGTGIMGTQANNLASLDALSNPANAYDSAPPPADAPPPDDAAPPADDSSDNSDNSSDNGDNGDNGDSGDGGGGDGGGGGGDGGGGGGDGGGGDKRGGFVVGHKKRQMKSIDHGVSKASDSQKSIRQAMMIAKSYSTRNKKSSV